MITSNITLILYLTGIITSSMLLLLFAPHFVFEKMFGLEAGSGISELIKRHWGFAIFITGMLLIWAGYDPAIRIPVLTCVALNKAVFVFLLLLNFKKGYLRNFALVFAFDVACIIIFGVYLLGFM